jgi:hypothetical protein
LQKKCGFRSKSAWQLKLLIFQHIVWKIEWGMLLIFGIHTGGIPADPTKNTTETSLFPSNSTDNKNSRPFTNQCHLLIAAALPLPIKKRTRTVF